MATDGGFLFARAKPARPRTNVGRERGERAARPGESRLSQPSKNFPAISAQPAKYSRKNSTIYDQNKLITH
jgi:hypothetical protein